MRRIYHCPEGGQHGATISHWTRREALVPTTVLLEGSPQKAWSPSRSSASPQSSAAGRTEPPPAHPREGMVAAVAENERALCSPLPLGRWHFPAESALASRQPVLAAM